MLIGGLGGWVSRVGWLIGWIDISPLLVYRYRDRYRYRYRYRDSIKGTIARSIYLSTYLFINDQLGVRAGLGFRVRG